MQNDVTVWQEEASVELIHESMDIRIGYPSILAPGDRYPEVAITAAEQGNVRVTITHLQSGELVLSAEVRDVAAKVRTMVGFQEVCGRQGGYKIDVELSPAGGASRTDAFYFTVVEKLPARSSRATYIDEAGAMIYLPDYRGNRLPDFSGVGYRGGGKAIPEVPVQVTLSPVPGDNTSHIQEAIDRVSRLPLDANGHRGAILLTKGIYEIASSLEIRASGVVLRGEGQGDFRKLWHDPDQCSSLEQLKERLEGQDATILITTGSERRRIIKIYGSEEAFRERIGDSSEITDSYVPVGANTFRVEDANGFSVGDAVIVQRSGNSAWIHEIGMDRIPPRSDGSRITQWSPFELEFEHVITAIQGNQITVDSSLMNAIEDRWGGGRIYKFNDQARISEVGVENLRGIAFWLPNGDGVDDTRHANEFIDLDYCRNGWVRNVTAEHFNSTNGAFRTGRGSKWITIQDSSSLIADKKFYSGKGYDPTGRTFYETNIYVGRYGFYLIGQSGLVLRCFALNNRHGFTLGSRVIGPNVFLDCEGEQPLTWSEPHHRWSVGGLYDNVHDMISLMNRLNMGSGHGWAGANYVAWNTEGTLVTHQPPTAQNWAIGHVGKKDPGGNRGPDGFWDSHGEHVEPRSLYLQQLKDRMGASALQHIGYRTQD
ncbi:hypothetical protein GCM10023310_26520 [Paenibacillus vulneris]|uniref:Pectate lyase n=1 Tax=Paenibacillus vulneris TaxID=1133364 RepID=A0ABW3URX2_9BACL